MHILYSARFDFYHHQKKTKIMFESKTCKNLFEASDAGDSDSWIRVR